MKIRDQIGWMKMFEPETRICLYCGNPFTITVKSQQYKKYCDKKCKKKQTDKSRIERRKEGIKRHPEWGIPTKHTCPECGKVFITKYPYKIYCDIKCENKPADYRRYHKMKYEDPLEFEKRKEKNKVNSKIWRDEHKEQGNCTRCGKHYEESLTVCSNCRQEMIK